MAAVTMLFGVVGLHTDLWWIRLIMFGRGVCMAFAFVPLQAATYANITPEDTGRASAIYSTQRQVAGSGCTPSAKLASRSRTQLTASSSHPPAPTKFWTGLRWTSASTAIGSQVLR